MKENYTQTEYAYNKEQVTNVVYNEKYKDFNWHILDSEIVLLEYKTKEHYLKPNKRVNIYVALFTTAWARLRLYELLDLLKEKVMYCDTDSVIFQDDNSESCKKIKTRIGSGLGELTEEISSKHKADNIKTFVSLGPKNYHCLLDTGKKFGVCKGFRLNQDAEDKITMDKKIKLVTDDKEKYELVNYGIIKANKKDRELKNADQLRNFSCEFDKRMKKHVNENLIISLPYGY
jgi:hypothetical protein